eukprot:gene18825-19140_t
MPAFVFTQAIKIRRFDLEQCDIYDCSFTLLRDLFFNGTNFSAGFAPFGDDSVALASEKRRVSDLKMIRGVAKLYQRTFEKFRYHDIRIETPEQFKGSSAPSCSPSQVSNVEATLKKPSTAFSSVYASKGRLDTPVMDMNIAALKSSMDDIDDEGSADRPHFSDYYYDDHNDDAIDQNNEEYSGPLEDGDYYGGVPGALVRSEGESFDSERKIEELRLPFEHLRSDRSSHSSQRNWDVNHIGLKKRRGYIRTARRPSSNRLDAELSRSRHCIMDQMADESCDGNGNEDCPCDASELDQAEAPLARPDPLLGSYSKVTSWSQGDDEILKSAESSGSSSKGRSKAKASVTVPVGSEIGTGNDGDRSSRRPRRMVEGSAWSTSVPSALQGDDLLLLELGENGALPKQASAAALSHSFASSPHALFAAFHSLGLDSEGFHNSATSIIAGDLEDMLRTFVLEDSIGRNNVLSIARKYYEDLDINFPNMDYTEYAANMDLGQVFLEVMTSVNEKGFAFIAPELERWQELGQVILSSSMPKSGWQEKRFLPEGQNYQLADDEKDAGTNYGTNRAEYSRAKQAVAEDDVYLDDTDESSSDHDFDVDMDEKEQASERQGGVRYSGGDIEVDLDGAYFNSFSLADRNRLLILSAFDIASNTDSFETFDLRLGLALGIVDNDKSRSLGSSSQ